MKWRLRIWSQGLFYAAIISTDVYGVAYTVTDLGTLGGAASSAAATNATGRIVGFSDSSDALRPGQAFFYDGTMQPLGTLGGARSGALDINDSGIIVGRADRSAAPADEHAFRYDGTMHDLGTLGGTYSLASGINNAGVIVGISETIASPTAHAFLYDGSMHDLGTFGGTYSNAIDINSAGHVTGYAQNASNIVRVYLYDGVKHDLGVPFGAVGGEGLAINDRDWIAGQWHNGAITNADSRALLYDGAMHDLGTLEANLNPNFAGTYSRAEGINNRGHVVGTANNGLQGPRAFLYSRNTGMVDLNALIDPLAGWDVTAAYDINDAGQIVGQGMHNGLTHGFLLTPVASAVPVGLLIGEPAASGGGGSGFLGRTLAISDFTGDSLNGGTVTGPVNVVVGAGVELTAFGGAGKYSIDAANAQVTITLTTALAAENFEVLRFKDALGAISGFYQILVNNATNLAGFSLARVAMDPESFSVNLSQLTATAGQKVVLDMRFVPVPEPTSMAMAALLAVALAAKARRRAAARDGSVRSSEERRPGSL